MPDANSCHVGDCVQLPGHAVEFFREAHQYGHHYRPACGQGNQGRPLVDEDDAAQGLPGQVSGRATIKPEKSG